MTAPTTLDIEDTKMTAPTTLDITAIAKAIDAAASVAATAQNAVTALAEKEAGDVANATAAIAALDKSTSANAAAIKTIQAELAAIASATGAAPVTPPVTTSSTTDTLTASFTAAVSGLALTVTDTSTSSAGTPAGSSFDFGDGESGSVSQGGSTTHDYAQPGTYTVTQTAKDSTGATATSTQAVTVAATAPVTTPPVTTPPVTTPPSSGGPTGPLAGGGSGSSAGTGTSSAIDLSTGLTDYVLSPIKFSPLAKPSKGQTVSDPDMPGATITRITDVTSDFASVQAVNCVPVYPTSQAWNCDESLMLLYVQGGNSNGMHVMYQGKPPYAYIKTLNVNPSDIEQLWWDRVDPNTLYYISNYSQGSTYYSQMVAYNVQTGVITVVHDFAADKAANGWQAGGIVRAGYPFFIGAPNNDLWGLGVGGIPNIGGYEAGDVFGWQRSTGQITKFQGLPQAQARTNFPTPLPSGKGWFYNNNSASAAANYTTDIYNREGVKIGSVPYYTGEHDGSNMNAAGEDYLVGNQYDTPVQGNIIVANLTQKSIKTLVGSANGYGYPRTGALTASACYNNPGWCVSGICGSPYGSIGAASAGSAQANPVTFLDQEIVIANADTGIVRRVCRHRSTGYWTSAPTNNYWAQPNVTLSPSGTRILVQSDWGNANPAAPVIDPNASSDTYVITLPAYKG